jgi:hypothetical protein
MGFVVNLYRCLFLSVLSVLWWHSRLPGHAFVSAGHEVLYNYQHQPDDFLPNEIVIVQYDSRSLAFNGGNNYWNHSALWNREYALRHGHLYAWLTTTEPECSYKGIKLSPVWCKVKAMVFANGYFAGVM